MPLTNHLYAIAGVKPDTGHVIGGVPHTGEIKISRWYESAK